MPISNVRRELIKKLNTKDELVSIIERLEDLKDQCVKDRENAESLRRCPECGDPNWGCVEQSEED